MSALAEGMYLRPTLQSPGILCRALVHQRKIQEQSLSGDDPKRMRTEEALRNVEERWRSVFENSTIGVALADLKGRLLAVNPTYQKMLGYTEEEFQTLSFLDFTHEDYVARCEVLAAELVEGKREQFQIEKQYRRKDGRPIWVRDNISLIPGTETIPRFIMALSEDITERKEAEALQNSEERVRLILDSSAEGIFGCDPRGTCLFSNQAAVRLLGYEEPAETPARTCMRWNTIPANGSPFPIDECPIYLGFTKTVASISTMTFFGERMAPVSRLSTGPIRWCATAKPSAPL